MTGVNDIRLAGKVIVIMGGTSGLGLSAAEACLRAGASVVVVGRDANKVRQAGSSLGTCCHAMVGDAMAPETAAGAIATALEKFSGFHALYHVAGGSGRRSGDGPLHEMTDEGWAHTLELNLSCVAYSNRAALKQFIKQGSGGTIVNMSSVLACSPAPHHFATHAYAAAKAGVVGLTKSTAAYYAPYNIRINAVAPGLVETPMAKRASENEAIQQYIATKQPLGGGRIGRPSDLDEIVVYLLSDAARFITGQIITVDGGWSVSEGQYLPSSNHDGHKLPGPTIP